MKKTYPVAFLAVVVALVASAVIFLVFVAEVGLKKIT